MGIGAAKEVRPRPYPLQSQTITWERGSQQRLPNGLPKQPRSFEPGSRNSWHYILALSRHCFEQVSNLAGLDLKLLHNEGATGAAFPQSSIHFQKKHEGEKAQIRTGCVLVQLSGREVTYS